MLTHNCQLATHLRLIYEQCVITSFNFYENAMQALQQRSRQGQHQQLGAAGFLFAAKSVLHDDAEDWQHDERKTLIFYFIL